MTARLERLAPLAGVGAAVPWLAGVSVVQSGNPADADRAEELAAYFRDDRTPILLGGLLVGLGTFLFLWFLAVLLELGLALALLLLVLPIAWAALILLLPPWLAALGLVLYRRPSASVT